MRARGLTVHLDIDGEGVAVVPARVTAAIANATREALSNVARTRGPGKPGWRSASAAAGGRRTSRAAWR